VAQCVNVLRVLVGPLVERLRAAAACPLVRSDFVLAVGKAAVQMARELPRAQGIILTKRGYGEALPGFSLFEAAHPIPDSSGVAATLEIARSLGELGESQTLLLLLSGGASALLAAPLPPVTLDELASATSALISGGADIHKINTVRRHLGLLLGGRLVEHTRARIFVFALSDVWDDDLATIGSGPACADATTLGDALAVARRYGLQTTLCEKLAVLPETGKPGDARFARVTHRILASPRLLRDAAAEALADAGVFVRLRDGLVHQPIEQFADELCAQSLGPGEAFLAVGEPTVELRGRGKGGRAQQLALEMARRIAGRRKMAFLACGTDGSDGPTDAAGAIVDGDTWAVAEERGLQPARALAENDAYPLLDALGALVRTGPTGTNLTDWMVLVREM
jgi:glycerate-2-kinase